MSLKLGSRNFVRYKIDRPLHVDLPSEKTENLLKLGTYTIVILELVVKEQFDKIQF